MSKAALGQTKPRVENGRSVVFYEDVYGVKQYGDPVVKGCSPATPCPAVLELFNTLYTNVAFLQGDFAKQPRLQLYKYGGTLNRHDAGLALDLILMRTDAKERALAHALLKVLLGARSQLQWRGLIYDNTSFNSQCQPVSPTTCSCEGASTGVSDYATKPNVNPPKAGEPDYDKKKKDYDDAMAGFAKQRAEHTTHIHIDWMNFGAVTLNTPGDRNTATRVPWPCEAFATGFGGTLGPKFLQVQKDFDAGSLSPVEDLSKLVGTTG